MQRPWSAALAAALLLSAACDEAAAPSGEPGSITVTAYVDVDGSGSPTTGDVLLQGFELALQRDGATVASATTGANGQATFENIEPGGYRIVAVSPAPAGAALATSPSPSAVVSFQGTAPDIEFRFVWYPGTITGRIYRDDGGTEAYEEGIDTPGAGVTVYLRSDAGGTAGDTITSTTADASGAYSFSGLAPGTYWIEFEQLGAMNYGTAGRVFSVTVAAQDVEVQNALFTGSIFMTIAEARAAPVNETVAVIGTITVPAGVFTSGTGGANSEIWVQDATGGIAVFSVPTASASEYPLHRVLEVVGTRGVFNGKEQISSPTTRSRGAGTAIAAQTLTGAQVVSLADEGELVRLANTRVDSLPGTGTTSFDVWTTAPDGQVVNVRVATGTGFARADFTVGTRYDVTGVLSEFRGTAQIQPRFATDVVVVGAPTARLIINEFMPDPRVVADGSGEYIEVHNWGDAPADLQNYSIGDHSTNAPHVIASSVVVPAGGHVLLALNGDPATNGGLTVDYVYANLFLNNSADGVILRDPSGTTVDSVAYTSYTSGVAWGVVDPSADNTVVGTGTNWTLQTTVYNTAPAPSTNEDRGTPRAQNDGYVAPSPTRLPLPTSPGVLSRDPLAPRRGPSLDGGARR